jgi:nonK
MIKSTRDTLVTGMGFCLPNLGAIPAISAQDVWEVCVRGHSLVGKNQRFHGVVEGEEVDAELARRWPGIPDHYRLTYHSVQKYALISLHQACLDANFEIEDPTLRKAAVLTARSGVDSNFDSYLSWYEAVPGELSAKETRDLFLRLLLGGTWSDVASVQTAAIRSRGTSFVVSSGCASSAEAIGIGANLIATGKEDIVIVTGADCFQLDRVEHGISLVDSVSNGLNFQPSHHAEPPMNPRNDRQMRPYDSRSDCVNYGSGAATLVLESREHASKRGARVYGRIIAQSTVRGGLDSAVALSSDGKALAEAAQNTLSRSRLSTDHVDFINGGAEGDPVFSALESNATIHLFGKRSVPPISSQEACFGHNGAPLGALEAALTLLMMQHATICPTAACEVPDQSLNFIPVYETSVNHEINVALSFNYQVGGVYSATLLGAPDD